MGKLTQYEPSKVYQYFELLSSVPHGSGNTRAVSDICVEFAKEHGLKYYRDDLNNIVIYKNGSAGYENAKPVIIQGHLDMVCAKNNDDERDMSKEPITIMTDGKMIWADGTSLGGDDIIAVAMALAVLDDDSLSHPPIEAFFTVDEETGMDGAKGFDYSKLSGKTLLNIDSEEEGVLTVSCAGGAHLDVVIPVEWTEGNAPEETISVEGLPGGHSGGDIAKEGHDNAIILLAQKLKELSENKEIRISDFTAGHFDNAIPDCAFVTSGGKKVITKESSENIIDYICSVPNGVIKMDEVFKDIPETSLSMGIIRLKEDGFHMTHLIRSSVNAEKLRIKDKVTAVAEEHGGKVNTGSEYPAWEYAENSRIRDIAANAYKKVTGKEVRIEGTHGGLECALFSSFIPGVDSISLGPDLFDVHSVKEHLDMASVARVYEMLKEILKNLK